MPFYATDLIGIPSVRGPKEYDLADLPKLGWIVIESVGEENIYFTLEDGTEGFCKVLA